MTDDTEQCATHIHVTVKESMSKDRQKRAIEQVNTAGSEEGSFSAVAEGTELVISTSTNLLKRSVTIGHLREKIHSDS